MKKISLFFYDHASLLALLTYTSVATSKRFWLPSFEGPAFWLFDVASFVFLPLFIFWRFKLDLLPAYALSSQPKFKKIGAGQIIFFSIAGFLFFVALFAIGRRVGVTSAKAYPEWLPPLIFYKNKLPINFIFKMLVVMYLAFTAGIVEEIFYRGVTNSVAGKYFGGSRLVYIVISTSLFAIIHLGGGLANVVSAAFGGFAIAVVYVWSKDIRIPILIHTSFGLIWWS